MLDLLRRSVDSYSMRTLLTASKEERRLICSVTGWTFDPLLNQQLLNPTISPFSFMFFATIGLVSITFTVCKDPH